MPLPIPNLDDRTFDQLVEAAIAHVNAKDGRWKNPTVGDPGFVLIDVFAFIADQLLFRFNRIPEKAYVEFLNLIGARLVAPSASRATVTFTMQAPAVAKLTIPRGTRVSAARTGSSSSELVFSTVDDVTIAPGQTSADATVLNAELVENELVGIGTGDSGQVFTVKRAPIIGLSNTSFDVLVAVELSDDASLSRADARVVDAVAYEIWSEVDDFAVAAPDSASYICDRVSGTITFAPRMRARDASGDLNEAGGLLARVPAVGKKICVSYATGGGPAGNVVAGSLATIKDQVAGAALKVANNEPATGGRTVESLANALLRGPREFHSLQRAVTARDFETIALKDANVARARAYPKRDLWNYAAPGTVAVLLVPQYLLPEERTSGAVTAEALQSVEKDDTIANIGATIDRARPLGVVCEIDWVRYKNVRVRADVFVARGENPSAVHDRLMTKLHTLINPLPTPTSAGWKFDRPLHVSDVTSLILAERGVAYYDSVKLVVDDVPSTDVAALSADPTSPGRWYATSASGLYRSLDDAASWESVAAFPDERVIKVGLHAEAPGLLAVLSQSSTPGVVTSIVRISSNAGESWGPPAPLQDISVADLGWVRRSDGFTVLLATNKGLYEIANRPDAKPIQASVFDGDSQFGFFSITATSIGDKVVVAVAAQAKRGLWLSSQAGVGRSFERWPDPPNPDTVSVVRVQRDGTRAFLWAGYGSTGDDPGKGASRIEITGASRAQSTQNWDSFDGWASQSVRELSFAKSIVYAASFSGGVVKLDLGSPTPIWQRTLLGAGLPELAKAAAGGAAQKFFQPVNTVAASDRIVLAGCATGVFSSADACASYEPASASEFSDMVALPPMWLFASRPHELSVSEDKRGM
jgi:hypothetical protein